MLETDLRRQARILTLTLLGTLAMSCGQTARASTPSPDPTTLLGVYQGVAMGQTVSCPTAEPFNLSITVTLDSVGSANGGFVTSDGDNGPISLSFTSGTMLSGQFSGRSPDGTTFSGDLSGQLLDGTNIDVTIQNYYDSDGCMMSGGSIDVHRVDGGIGASASSAPSVLLVNEGARRGADTGRTVSVTARQRLQAGKGNGMMRFGNGVMLQGRAAGSSMPIGAWAAYSRTSTENDFVTTSYKDTRHDFLGGLDTLLHDGNTLVGIALGIQTSDTTTRFNGGTQNLTAITVAPYVAMLLTDWLSFDATVGYSDVQIDQTRTAVGSGAQITSDVESMRLFGALNFTATHRMDNLMLSGLGGLTWATQRDDSFRESSGLLVSKQSSDLGRFLLGGEVAYSASSWEPYAKATFEYDFTKSTATFAPGVATPNEDDTDVLVGLGVRYFGDNGVSGSVEYSTLLGRSNLDEETLSANVRWEF